MLKMLPKSILRRFIRYTFWGIECLSSLTKLLINCLEIRSHGIEETCKKQLIQTQYLSSLCLQYNSLSLFAYFGHLLEAAILEQFICLSHQTSGQTAETNMRISLVCDIEQYDVMPKCIDKTRREISLLPIWSVLHHGKVFILCDFWHYCRINSC